MGIIRDYLRTGRTAATIDRKLLRSVGAELKTIPSDRKMILLDDESGNALIVDRTGLIATIDVLNQENVRDLESDFNLGQDVSAFSMTRYGWFGGMIVKNDASFALRKNDEVEAGIEGVDPPPTRREAWREVKMSMKMGLLTPSNDEVVELMTYLHRARRMTIEDLQGETE